MVVVSRASVQAGASGRPARGLRRQIWNGGGRRGHRPC